MMNCVLIVSNFNAGRKKAIKYKKKVIGFVLKRTKIFKFVDIDELKDIDTAQYDTILVMGGDGTVNKVLPFLVNSDKTLGIIPCGTANLLASKLGFSSNIDRTLSILDKQNIIKIDVIKVNEFLSSLRLGMGYDADIITKTPQSLKNKFGYFAYFIAGIIFALRLKIKSYEFEIDNIGYKIDASCVIIGNTTNMYKNLISLNTDTLLDDGIFDIFILKTTNPILFFIELIKIFFRCQANNSNATYLKAKSIKIKNSWLNCHIDGERCVIKNDIDVSVINKSINVYSNA